MKTEILYHYCPSSDMTFITRETYQNNELIKIENIGFCFGQVEELQFPSNVAYFGN